MSAALQVPLDLDIPEMMLRQPARVIPIRPHLPPAPALAVLVALRLVHRDYVVIQGGAIHISRAAVEVIGQHYDLEQVRQKPRGNVAGIYILRGRRS